MTTPDDEKKVAAPKRSKPQTTNTRVVVRFRPINRIEKEQWKKDIFKNCVKEAQLEAVSPKLQAIPELKDPKNWPKYANEKWDNWLKDKCSMQPGHLRLFKRFCREFDFSKLDKNSMKDVVPVEVYEEQRQIQIFIPEQGETKAFAFDEVMWWQRNQTYCFQTIAQPVMEDALRGFNATIFAYGQSGSGKTYTLFGPEPLDKAPPEQLGVIPSSLAWIFKVLEGDPSNKFFEIKLSFLEVYLERLRDLMNPFDSQGKEKKLKIMELAGGKAALDAIRGKQSKQAKQSAKNRRGARMGRGRKEPAKKKAPIEVVIDNLSEQRVDNIAQVQALIATAAHHRTKEKTNLNASSSRSHLIMCVRVNITKKSGTVIKSKINFADLAGSEKVGKTDVTGKHLKEAAAINTSLTALRTVIDGLVKQKKFVSFRDSKLTRALRDSLGGNTKTTLVLGCSPHKWNLEETLETLKFGARAKFIRSKVIVNAQASVEQLEKVIEGLKKENEMLKKKLQIEHAKQGIRRLEHNDSMGSIPKESVDGETSPIGRSPKGNPSIVLSVLKQEKKLGSRSTIAEIQRTWNNKSFRRSRSVLVEKEQLTNKRASDRHSRTNSGPAIMALLENRASLQLELDLQKVKDENRDLNEELEVAQEREEKYSLLVEELMEKITLLEDERKMQIEEDLQKKEFIEETTFALDGQLESMKAKLELKERMLADTIIELETYRISNLDIPYVPTQGGGRSFVDIYSEHGEYAQLQSKGLSSRINDLIPAESPNAWPSRLVEEEKKLLTPNVEDDELFLTASHDFIRPPLNLGDDGNILNDQLDDFGDDSIMGASDNEIDVGRIEAVFNVLNKLAKIGDPEDHVTLNQLIEVFERGKLSAGTCMIVYSYLPEDRVTLGDIQEVIKVMALSMDLRKLAANFKDYLIKVADDFASLIGDLPSVEDVMDMENPIVTLEAVSQIELGEMHALLYQEAFQYLQSERQEEVQIIDFQIFIDHLAGRGSICGLQDGPEFQEEVEEIVYSGFRVELIERVKKIFEADGKDNLSMSVARIILQEIRESMEDIDDSDPALAILYDLSLKNLEAVIRSCPENMWHTLIEKPVQDIDDSDYD